MSQTKTFLLPDLGEGLPDATIVEWFVKVGDTIRLDDNLVSMETAKAVVEVPSPVSGKVLKLAGGPGDVIVTGRCWPSSRSTPRCRSAPKARTPAHHHGAGSHVPSDGDKVIASDDGGTISAAGTPQPQAEKRDDAGTVVGAMQTSDAVRSEQRSPSAASRRCRRCAHWRASSASTSPACAHRWRRRGDDGRRQACGGRWFGQGRRRARRACRRPRRRCSRACARTGGAQARCRKPASRCARSRRA
jgi:pyruvate/2-oxoglutarate dehydrogenase complex dihydrolipoamide acyltransferase (E2) component